MARSLFLLPILLLAACAPQDNSPQGLARAKCEAEAKRQPKLDHQPGSLGNAANRAQRESYVRSCMTKAGFVAL